MKSSAMKFLNIFWIFSLIYYCFGRVQWKIDSYILVVLYATICYLCINIGYYRTNRKIRCSNYSMQPVITKIEYKNIAKFFRLCCIITVIFQVGWVFTYFHSFSIVSAITKIGSNYFDRLDTELSGNSFFLQIRTLLWIFAYFVYPIGFSFFSEMKIYDKAIFIFTMLIDILASLNMGISKNIGDVIIIFLAVLFLNPRLQGLNDNIKQKMKKHRRMIFTAVVVGVIFLISFGAVQIKRNEALGRSAIPNTVRAAFGTIRPVTIFDYLLGGNSIVVSVFDQFARYISHGYTGLAYALSLPFKNTWGLGFSRALMDYARQYLGISVSANTYCARIDEVYGWTNGVYWPTAFVWIGSAVTFWGVPIVMYFLGKLFCKAEYNWKIENKVVSLVLYCQLFLAFVFMPCNAQIVQSRASFTATFLLLIMYCLKNKKIVFGDKKIFQGF